MVESIKVSRTFQVKPQKLYRAWLSSKEHSAFTGGKAEIDPKVGGAFTAWDGYIEGRTLEVEPNRRIVQSWRTTNFPQDAEDSRLEIRLEEVEGGTRLTLLHGRIPDGQGEDYRQGWKDHYFEPMRAYFSPTK